MHRLFSYNTLRCGPSSTSERFRFGLAIGIKVRLLANANDTVSGAFA
jgi:hypothetical protein